MAGSSGSATNPSSRAVTFPTEEETCKNMQNLLDSLLIHRMHNTAVVNPEDLGNMTAKFQVIASGFVAFLWKEYKKLHEKCAIDVKKSVDEKADLEARLSSVTEKLNREKEEVRGLKLNREMEEIHGLNLKLKREMEEVRGLNLKLNREMEAVRMVNSKFKREMGEVRSLNSKLKHEMDEVRGRNSKLNCEMEDLSGRNSKKSKRLVELGGEIELAREESKFLRSKNKRLCSENKRLKGQVDSFGAREHAIKLEAVNKFASDRCFFKQFPHLVSPDIMLAGQMGVDQMAKIAGVPSVTFKVVPGYKYPSFGHYKIPKPGEIYMGNEQTLEAWKRSVRGKRKANDLAGPTASRPRTDKPTSRGPTLIAKRK